MPDFLKSLLQSRKFWLTLVTSIVAGVLFARGEITAEQFANSLAGLGMVLVAAIAIEDAAEKYAAPRVETVYERTPHSAGAPISSFQTDEEKTRAGWTD